MPDLHQPAVYRAYLLRCWAEDPAAAEQHTWRFSLEGMEEGQRRGFTTLEALVKFIRSELGETRADNL
jgi:hypothetical protein